MKTPITQTSDPAALAALESMSKTALADLVVDLLRRIHGEALDGEELATELREAFSPLERARRLTKRRCLFCLQRRADTVPWQPEGFACAQCVAVITSARDGSR